MNWIITNWENDMVDTPEQPVLDLLKNKFSHYEFKMLAAFDKRSIEDVYDSLRESRAVIIHPELLDNGEQVAKIVSAIWKGVYHNTLGNKIDGWMIKDFVFVSSTPFEDLQTIKKACNPENLAAILRNCHCEFYGYNGELYELKTTGYYKDDFYAVRYS